MCCRKRTLGSEKRVTRMKKMEEMEGKVRENVSILWFCNPYVAQSRHHAMLLNGLELGFANFYLIFFTRYSLEQ
ncbi:hypothetical protein M758_2G073200 [Ceratodon purpureus]|nr:hypothetical protein M758_2G073200 [Ceratodon purpureus]